MWVQITVITRYPGIPYKWWDCSGWRMSLWMSLVSLSNSRFDTHFREKSFASVLPDAWRHNALQHSCRNSFDCSFSFFLRLFSSRGSSLTRASAQCLFEAWQTQWRRWGLMDAVQMGNDNRFDWTWVSWACKDDRQSTTSCGRAQQIGHSEATTVGIRPENCFTGKCVHFRAVAYYRYVNSVSWHYRVFILSGSIVA